MKRPNKHIEKKYISSLAVAAFLLLSVLTAYNIHMNTGNPEDANTEVEETLGDAQKGDAGDAGQADTSAEEQMTDGNTSSRTTTTEKSSDEKTTNAEENSTKDKDEKDGNTAEEDKDTTSEETNTFHYDGERKLTWPVVGNVILPYSMDTTVYYTTLNQYACNDGVLIGAKTGTEVVAAADGKVVNLSDSDRYGTTLTVLIGDYYEVYYSQIDNVKYGIGDEIKEGDVIGTVAEPTRSFVLEGPHLFFKMTCKGEAVNPTEYLE